MDPEDNATDTSKKNKLSIKIKLPGQSSGCRSGEEEEFTAASALSGRAAASSSISTLEYICEYCGRTFPSGKSWGGHKRHHLKIIREGRRLQKAQNPKPKINIASKQPTSIVKCVTATVDGGISICSLCGKKFRSMNSLFGHMRFHPDRSWRGMYPPSSTGKSISDVSEAVGSRVERMQIVSGVDLMASLKSGWTKTDKRGRICLSNYSASQAAYNLITLSQDWHGSDFKRNTKKTRKSEMTLSEYRSKSLSRKLKFHKNDDALKSSTAEKQGGNSRFDDEVDEGRSAHKNMGKLKEKLKIDDEFEEKVDDEFEICRLARKKKTDIEIKAGPELNGCGTTVKGASSCCSLEESSPTETGKDKSIVAILESTEHEDNLPLSVKTLSPCDTCSCETFPTDEALLEGHRSCHSNTLSKPASPSNEVPWAEEVNHSTEDRAESSTEATRMLGIDLNMPYVT